MDPTVRRETSHDFPHLRHHRHRTGSAPAAARQGLGPRGVRARRAAAARPDPREGEERDRRADHDAARQDRRRGPGRGEAGGPEGRRPGRGRLRQHRPRGRQPHQIPFSNTRRRPHRRHRRVRVPHHGRGGPHDVAVRADGAREDLVDLASVPSLAGRRGDGQDRPRGGHRPHRQELHQEGRRLRHGRALLRPRVPGPEVRRVRAARDEGAARGRAGQAAADDRLRAVRGGAPEGRLRHPPRQPDAAGRGRRSRPSTSWTSAGCAS